jgi:macrodomain Ter protein organizer (MatP/YcbG family)
MEYEYAVKDNDTGEALTEYVNNSAAAQNWISDYCRNTGNPDGNHPKRALSLIKRAIVIEREAIETSHADEIIARFYILKSERSKKRDIEFNLSFAEFKRLSSAKKCRFTGLELTAQTFSIDRIDNAKGYVTGNVAACHKAFNKMKGCAENPESDFTIPMLAKAFALAAKLIKEG